MHILCVLQHCHGMTAHVHSLPEHALLYAGLRDASSNISVTATLENAQRIVSKIPETAANEEDIVPLLQEFEDLTAQLQAELDKLSAVTNNIGRSSL